MDELKLIVELLRDVSQHAAMGIIIYMVLDFLKVPLVVGTVGYCINLIIKNFKVEVHKK